MENYLTTGFPCDCRRTAVPASQSRGEIPAVRAAEGAQVSPPWSVSDTGAGAASIPKTRVLLSSSQAEGRENEVPYGMRWFDWCAATHDMTSGAVLGRREREEPPKHQF